MDIQYNTEWFANLIKPSFQPPNWVFAPTWAILYILMFVSLFLIIKEEYSSKHLFAYLLFIIQLLLNLSWSPIFFVFHKIKAALFICIILTFIVFLMVLTFYSISKLSGLLLLPYLFWLIFASILNFKIHILNN